MKTYRGLFGALYAINAHNVVCVKTEGESEWRASAYTLEHFQDAIIKGAVKEVQEEKTYIVELEGRVQSFEVPVYAKSLEEATLLSQEYEDAGFVVGRIRPEV